MGLLGGKTRNAIVSGAAAITRNAVNSYAAKKNADAQDAVDADHAQRTPVAAPPPAAPAAQEEDVISQLERLGELNSQGILTEEEF